MRQPRSLLFALTLCALLHADNYPRQPGIDVQHYIFRVTLHDNSDEIQGETTVRIRFVQAGVREFSLDLAGAADGKGMTVEEITSAGAPVPYTHQSNRLTIALATRPASGEIREFTIKYGGIPAGGLHMARNKYGDRCFFSTNWPDLARQWLPTLDHPYDKATSEFVVTAPARYQVVANGRLEEEIDLPDGNRTTHWHETVPIATWLNNIGVAQFASVHFGSAAGVPLQTWVFPKDREAGIATFDEPMRQSIEFFSTSIGPYPYEKLAGVQNGAARGGGMEHASAIFYGENTVIGKPALSLVAHETAHQWFGDSVTENDWDDVWLSEGFATYFSALTIEHYEGGEEFRNVMTRSRAGIFRTETRLNDVAVVQKKAWSGIPNGIVYQKGAWTLHMLRGQMGDDRFWTGIREYYRRYRDGNASTADFRKTMEQAAGADLGWFFDQWLYRPGSPKVEMKSGYDNHQLTITLTQTQPGDAYRLPLEIKIGSKIEKVDFTQKTQVFRFSAERKPDTIELDPYVRMLIQ